MLPCIILNLPSKLLLGEPNIGTVWFALGSCNVDSHYSNLSSFDYEKANLFLIS